MDKNRLYQDSHVRGQNSRIKHSLYFTEQAKQQYDDLTGSQKTFVNELLNKIKRCKENISQEIRNDELKMRVKYRKQDDKIVVTAFDYPSRQNDQNYIEAKKRMLDWNN